MNKRVIPSSQSILSGRGASGHINYSIIVMKKTKEEKCAILVEH